MGTTCPAPFRSCYTVLRMNTHLVRSSIIGLLVLGVVSVAAPVSVAADTATSTAPNAQIQALMDQIKGLQQQLMTLLQARKGDKATTTPPVIGCRPIVRALMVGMRGDDVKDFQDQLIHDGLLTGTSTGFFGEMTRDAVKRWQERNGVGTSTGAVGPLTRDIFNKRCGMGPGPMGTTTPNGMPLPRFEDGKQPWGPNATGTQPKPEHPIWNGSTTPPVFPNIPGKDGKPASTTGPGLPGMIKDALKNFMPLLAEHGAEGTITAVGNQSITVQNAGGASKLVKYDDSTIITVATASSTPSVGKGTAAALTVGLRVLVMGSPSNDGSVKANSIVIINGVQNW
jgi:peptidoglycan hydrolase-like protein with peptidoglycan-binding domain